jgi:hypothetical protein
MKASYRIICRKRNQCSRIRILWISNWLFSRIWIRNCILNYKSGSGSILFYQSFKEERYSLFHWLKWTKCNDLLPFWQYFFNDRKNVHVGSGSNRIRNNQASGSVFKVYGSAGDPNLEPNELIQIRNTERNIFMSVHVLHSKWRIYICDFFRTREECI